MQEGRDDSRKSPTIPLNLTDKAASAACWASKVWRARSLSLRADLSNSSKALCIFASFSALTLSCNAATR